MPYRSIYKLRLFWQKHIGVLPLARSIPELTLWFKTPLGDALLAEERHSVDRALQCLFGYHLLQLSISPELDLGEQSRISHRFALHSQLANNPRLSALADFTQLPLSAESMDVVLLHHTLDFSEHPHQLLREVSRVLIPRGHLLIVGFNPWSLWGIARWFARFLSAKSHWRHQSLRLHRVVDWLTLLDFETLDIQQGFYRLPLSHPKAIKHLHWMEAWGKKLRLACGGYYVILACKDRVGMTPLKVTWPDSQRTPLSGLTVTKILGRAQTPMPVLRK